MIPITKPDVRRLLAAPLLFRDQRQDRLKSLRHGS
jgi:hypothetical protein